MKDQNDYKKIFNLSMDIICVVCPDGNFKKINQAFTSDTYRQFGFFPNEHRVSLIVYR